MRKNNVEDLKKKNEAGENLFRIWLKQGERGKCKTITALDRNDAKRKRLIAQASFEKEAYLHVKVRTSKCFYLRDLLYKNFEGLIEARKKDTKAIRDYWIKTLGDVHINKFNTSLLGYVQEDLAKDYKPATINRYISFLKQTFRKAFFDWQLLPQDFSVFLKNVKVQNQRNRILTEDEKVRLFEAAKELGEEYFIDLLYLLFSTGMRKMEALSLKCNECDFDSNKILINRTKNGQSRKLRMTPQVREILLKRRERNGENGYVFDKLRCPCNTSVYMKRVCKHAKINNFVLHDIRHYFASKMMENGVIPEQLQKIMGHSTYHSLNRYLHFGDDSGQEKMLEILENKMKLD